MRWIMTIIVMLLWLIPVTAQEFPDGLIAYARTIECEVNLGWCSNGIKIINPNTGESIIFDAEENYVFGETIKWSPDQRYITYLTNDNFFNLVDLATREEIGKIEFYNNRVWFYWHPNLPLIAFIYQIDLSEEGYPLYQLFVFDVLEQKWFPQLEHMKTTRPFGISWSPDGQSLLFKQSDRDGYGDIYHLNIITNTVTNLTDHPEQYGFPDWSIDGQKILYAIFDEQTYSSQIAIMNLSTREVNIIYEAKDEFLIGLAWVLGDSAILFSPASPESENDEEFYILDLVSEEVKLVLTVPNYFSGYDLSQDRTAIVYLAAEVPEKDVCIFSLITSEEHCLEGEKAHYISFPAW